MTAQTNQFINGQRLWDSLMEMAKIGATPKGGVCRLAATDVDKAGRDLFIRWCKDAGCTVSVDAIGNIFAHRPGRNPDLPPILMGSHLDSQPTGGKFDGVYGVLAGLEVVRTLNDLGMQTDAAIEVVSWTNEEGSRFAPAMVASGVYAGAFDLDYGLSRKDVEGKTLGEELARIGYAGDAPIAGRPLGGYFEAHIEQGPILEAEDKLIGVVTDAQGQRWYEATFTGQEAHAGSTPMERRHDALLGAAKVIQAVNAIGLSHAPHARTTVGMMQVRPNSRNVIPGEVFFTVDMRHPDEGVLAEMDAELRAIIAEVAEIGGLTVDLQQIWSYAPVKFTDACVAAVRDAVETLGYSRRDMVSGAGHDACYMARVCPTSMIFIPCVDGISHNEIEHSHPHWVEAGGNVLLRAVVTAAMDGWGRSTHA